MNFRTLIILLPALLAASALQATTYDLPIAGEDIVGEIQYTRTRYEDTFVDLARRFNVGYRELRIANPGVDPWLPGENTLVAIPSRYILPDAPREGIIVNVPEMRLYYYPRPRKGERPKVATYPISVGRQDWHTPLGTTRLVKKVKGPAWYPPESIRREHAEDGDPLPKVVPPGPDNPLGDYALRLGIPGYLLHGTNKPNGIGMQVTHGCIRLFPEDIENLYRSTRVGTKVTLVYQPFKTGWHDGVLYLEAHPPVDFQDQEMRDLTPVVEELVEETSQMPGVSIDWALARSLASSPTGIPVPITLHTTRTADADSDPALPATALPAGGHGHDTQAELF